MLKLKTQSNLGIFASQGQLSISIKMKFDEEQHTIGSLSYDKFYPGRKREWVHRAYVSPKHSKTRPNGQTCDLCASRWHSERWNFAGKIIAQVQLYVPHFAPIGEGVWWAYIRSSKKSKFGMCTYRFRFATTQRLRFNSFQSRRHEPVWTKACAAQTSLVNWFIERMTRKPSLEVAPTCLATVFLL